MKVVLPFSTDHLSAVPSGFDVVVADAVDDWPDNARDAEFYVPSYRFSAAVIEVISSLPHLRVVQTLTAGVDHIVPVIPPGVTLCNAAGVHDAATSELAVGLMIAAQRRLPDLVRAQDQQVWDQQMSSSLADQHVLVVGAGHIGHAVQRRLSGFECEVTLVGRTARPGVRASHELPILLPQADIVLVIVPITDETAGMVDRAFLARMRDGALLVNVSRGAVVVTDDLIAELRSGRLRAALDVTDPEPLPAGHPLWSAPGVIITPHVGGASSAMWPRAYRLVGEQLRRLSAGEPLLNQVN
ncbi:MAG: 2-hydroxyacid dehydrogenase [Nocardioidaceae bacterium]